MSVNRHLVGLLLGAEEDWPQAFEAISNRLGAIFEKVRNWEPFSITDGRLVTGQNPASSTSAAQNLLKVARTERAAA